MDVSETIAAAIGIEPSTVFVVNASGVDEALRMQAPQSFVVVVERDVVARLDAASRRLLLHNVATHLLPGGLLLTECETTTAMIGADAEATGLKPCGSIAGHFGWRREERRNIHDLLAEARTRIRRWTARELEVAQRVAPEVHGLLVLDIRTPTDRERDGVIPGSIHAPRTSLEWRVDPASGYSFPEIQSFDQLLVVVCTDGYGSSLAAATLVDLGFDRAGDLVGGIMEWGRAGLPLTVSTRPYIGELL